jgi:hypothetical protein
VALAVSGAFTLTALLGLGLSVRADAVPLRSVAVALTPPLLGTAFMGASLYALQRGLGGLGLAPSPLRLVLEIVSGMLLYAAYLRLVHRSLWRQATSWLAERRRGSG